MRPDTPRPLYAGPEDGPEPPFPVRVSGKVIKGFGRGSKEVGRFLISFDFEACESAVHNCRNINRATIFPVHLKNISISSFTASHKNYYTSVIRYISDLVHYGWKKEKERDNYHLNISFRIK